MKSFTQERLYKLETANKIYESYVSYCATHHRIPPDVFIDMMFQMIKDTDYWKSCGIPHAQVMRKYVIA